MKKKWSKELILEELKSFKLKEGRINPHLVERKYLALYKAAFRHFGSWKTTCEAIGIKYDDEGLHKKWDRNLILEEIGRVWEKEGKVNSNLVQKKYLSLYCAAVRHFGSWKAAFKSLGIDYTSVRIVHKKWKKSEIIDEIKSLDIDELYATNLKRKHSKLYSVAIKRFGSLEKAIQASNIDYELILKRSKKRMKEKLKVWTSEMVIERIKEYKEQNLKLNDASIRKFDTKLYSAGIKIFGSWGYAIEAAGFNYEYIRRLNKWNEEKVIEHIKTLHNRDFDLSNKSVVKHYSSLHNAAVRRFSNWEGALEIAGIDYNKYRRKRKNKRYSRAEIIDYIVKRFCLGEEVNAKSIDPAIYQQARIIFGSWKIAILSSGIEYDEIKKVGQSWSKDKVITEIRKLNDKGMPLNNRYIRDKDRFLYYAGRTHFNSWKNAIINSGLDYGKVRKEPKKEMLLGKAFEFLFRRMVQELNLNYIDHPRFEVNGKLYIPDFVYNKNHWIDLKLNSWTSTIKDTLKSYLEVAKTVTIIYLKGNKRGSLSNRVKFVSINDYYPILKTKGLDHHIEMFELLKGGEIPDEM